MENSVTHDGSPPIQWMGLISECKWIVFCCTDNAWKGNIEHCLNLILNQVFFPPSSFLSVLTILFKSSSAGPTSIQGRVMLWCYNFTHSHRVTSPHIIPWLPEWLWYAINWSLGAEGNAPLTESLEDPQGLHGYVSHTSCFPLSCAIFSVSARVFSQPFLERLGLNLRLFCFQNMYSSFSRPTLTRKQWRPKCCVSIMYCIPMVCLVVLVTLLANSRWIEKMIWSSMGNQWKHNSLNIKRKSQTCVTKEWCNHHIRNILFSVTSGSWSSFLLLWLLLLVSWYSQRKGGCMNWCFFPN